MKHALYIPRLYSDRAYEGARLQVTRACTRSDIAPSRRVARRSLRTTDIGNRDNAPEIVGGSPSETSEVFWSIDVLVPLHVPLQVKNGLFERN